MDEMCSRWKEVFDFLRRLCQLVGATCMPYHREIAFINIGKSPTNTSFFLLFLINLESFSMLCDSTRYICSCHYDSAKSLDNNGDFSASSHLGALFFCPKCQDLRCEECSEVSVKSKYCTRCMTDYTDNVGQTRCLRNCFECPSCYSPVDVKGKDEVGEEGKGKRFFFKCVYCPFQYQTKLITRPSSLVQILKRESTDQHAKVVAKYTAMYKLNNKPQGQKHTINRPETKRLEAMKIKQVNLADDQELEKTIAESGPLDIMGPTPEHLLQPRGTPLATKVKIRCSSCHEELLSPVTDIKLIKVLSKQYASDILPTLTASYTSQSPTSESDTDIPCSLSIVNNLPSSINVVISIYGRIPASLTNDHVAMSLPISSVSIGGKREKAEIIQTIPTVLLGSNTKASQAEQVMRSGKTAQETGETVDQGSNWATIPFTLSFEEGQTPPKAPIQVPFHVEVETRLPDAWKLLSSKRGLRYKFWAVSQIQS